MTFKTNTYVISNRKNDSEISSTIDYQFSPNAPNQMYNDNVGMVSVAMAVWYDYVAKDLITLSQKQPVSIPLVFQIHGFHTTAEEARRGQAQYGNLLYAEGLAPGLVIGVSWPSATWTPAGGRENAENSYPLFHAVLTAFEGIQASLKRMGGNNAPTLLKVIICHSMGNYLMSKALTSGKIPVDQYRNRVDRVIMLAPDVDRRIFTQESSVLNQGKAIYDMCSGNVQVLWTGEDDILAKDEWIGMWTILGYRGLQAPLSPSTPSVSFYDCTKYARRDYSYKYVPGDYISQSPPFPPDGVAHSACRFVPDLILLEIDFITHKTM